MAPPRKYDDRNPPVQTCPHCGETFRRKIRVRVNGHRDGAMPQKYCSRACSNAARARGSIDKHGYRLIHMGSRQAGQRYEHHLVVEEIIGRRLLPGETVHHKNGKRADNRPENLELWSSRHGKGQRVDERVADALQFLAEHGFARSTFVDDGIFCDFG